MKKINKCKIKMAKKFFLIGTDTILKKEKKKINTINILPFEQNVNPTYFYLTLSDFSFYKFSNLKMIWNMKNLSKILHSSLLRKKFFIDFSIFKKIEKSIILYNTYFTKNKNLKINTNAIYNVCTKGNKIIFLYIYSNFNYFSFLTKKKSVDKNLVSISLLFIKNKNEFFSVFYPYLYLKEKKKKLLKGKSALDITKIIFTSNNKKWLFRSIPKKKIFDKILSTQYFNVPFNTITNLKYNIFYLKLTSMFFLKKTLKLVLLVFLRFFKEYYFFILICLILFNWKFFYFSFLLKSANFFYLEENAFMQAYFTNLNIYSSNERFTKSHILNNNFKKRSFLFFQGSTTLNNLFSILQLNITITYLKLTEILKIDYLFLTWKNKPKINYYLTYEYAYLKSLNNFSYKNFFLSIFQFSIIWKDLICKGYLPSFYFISFNEKKINFLMKSTEAYTLSVKLNYLFTFNKYFWLDGLSTLLTNYLFFDSSFYNLNFFFFRIYNFLFLKVLNTTFLLRRFEVFFFWKNFLFRPSSVLNFFYISAIKTAENSLYSFLYKVWKYYFFCLKENAWFNYKFFIEELFHLSYEYRFVDYERIQEYIRVKQLAELWLIKLTNYLKLMRGLKKDPGNIQYSPDFTQQHEFALTLKWGLELEALRFTKTILIRWFFGNILNKKKNNPLIMKIKFLFNFSKLNKKTLEFNIKKIKIFKFTNLKLKEIFELIWLQLASVLSSYRNIHKFKLNQLESFHFNFQFRDENFLIDLYKFIFLSFDRYFITTSYYKYYKTRNIKKRIWFSKLIQKKIFNWFTLSSKNFSNLLFLKNINFFNLFRSFKLIKKKILRTAKTKFFYQVLLNLIIKTFKTFSLPSNVTLLDKNFYYLELNNLNNSETFKYSIFLKNKLLTQNLKFNHNDVNSIYLFFLSTKAHLIKYYLYSNTTIIKYFLSNQGVNFFQANFSENHNSFLNLEDHLKNYFNNLFSEYVYDVFYSFLNENKLKIQLHMKNKSSSTKFFFKLNSDNFSKLFYTMLDQKTLTTTKFVKLTFFKLFLSNFSNKLYSKYNLKVLLRKFKLSIFLKQNKFLNYKSFFTYKTSVVHNMLVLIYEHLKIKLFSNSFLNEIVNNLVYRFLLFINNDNNKFFIKKLQFDKIFLKNFNNQLKLIILNFFIFFIKMLLKQFNVKK